MNKTLGTSIAATALALAGLVTTPAHAADGNINFNGKLIAAPCSIATESKDQTVDMGAVATNAFSQKGDRASPKSFQLKLTQCSDAASAATVRFDGTSTPEDPGVLAVGDGANAANNATGVGIELADASGQRIAVADDSPSIALVKGDNTLNFRARYVAVQDAVTAGQANATSQFTINYQ
jgi:major type 1 subunit fimbrin (pilin)